MNPSYNGTFDNGNADEPARAPVFGAGAGNDAPQPASPEQPVSPEQPTSPAQPAQPVQSQPEQPTQPIQPATPMTPQQPIMSRQPIMPRQPTMSSPMGPATGDIVIGGSEKKSRKGLIIGVIIAVLVIGGLAAATFLMPKNSTSTAAKEAFNKYANYLLYGEDSTAPLEGEYDENGIYKIDEINEGTETTEYLKTASKLLGDFESIEKNNSDEYKKALLEYHEDFDLVQLTLGKTYITEDDLVNVVLNNDLETTKKWITSKYQNLEESQYEGVRDYAKVAVDYYDAFAEYLDGAKNNGCLSVGGISCTDYSNSTLETRMVAIDGVMATLESNARDGILKGCWTINGIISSKGSA